MSAPPAWLVDLRETPAAFIPSMDLPALCYVCHGDWDEHSEACTIYLALAAYRAGPR